MRVSSFFERLSDKQAVVGIVGLGYVGLPLMLSYASRGLHVIGFDVDQGKVDSLKDGRSYIRHIADREIDGVVSSGLFQPTSDYSQVADCDAVMLCVPTPLGRHHDPDMNYIECACRDIAPHLRKGQLVVLESTTYPGTTDEVVCPLLEAGSGLKAGKDFWLAFSPEREDPGNARFSTRAIPKVVGGMTATCREAAAALYSSAMDKVVPVSSNRAAEMTKLLENVFRCVNIALVNELKVVCEAMGVDIWEVIDAASTKPFGFMPFYPGPGLGGHCIPIDPYYLSWKAREFEVPTRFIELAGEVNASMPGYVVFRVSAALNTMKKALNGSTVLILGVAYKRDVDDVRESPALRLVDLLQHEGANVQYHDPFVAKLDHGHDLTSTPLTAANLAKTDAVLIVTDHTGVDYSLVVNNAPLVVDTRNATRGISFDKKKVFRA